MKHIKKVIWFFGLSGAGKTTLANELGGQMKAYNLKPFILDGDIIRNGINSDLSYERKDRKENVRRLAEVCKLFLQVNVTPIVAAITPYESDRKLIKDILGDKLILVHVACPISECKKRDPKGLYAQAQEGKIKKFTGITDPFENTSLADVILNTERLTSLACIELLLKKLVGKK